MCRPQLQSIATSFQEINGNITKRVEFDQKELIRKSTLYKISRTTLYLYCF